jgi:hypothetical protein
VAAILALIFNFGLSELPILRSLHSVTFPIIVISFFLTLGAFYYGYMKGANIKNKLYDLKISRGKIRFFAITLGIIFSLLMIALSTILAVVINNAFIGLTLDPYISSIFAGIYSAILIYYVLKLSINLDTTDLISVWGIFLIGGVLISMITVNDTNWWENNFSFLGTWRSGSFLVFNLTLILAALALIVVVEYIFEGNRKAVLANKKASPKKYNFTKGIFIFMALTFGGVGLFPWVGGTILASLHNLSVTLLAWALFFTLFAIRWLIPILPKSFYYNSWAIGGLLVVATGVYIFTSYMNQTAYEMACFFGAGAWILLFLGNLRLVGSKQLVTA